MSEPMERGHAERLAPLVEELMRGAGVAFDAVDRIAVTVGPGSFTGVRVGLSFARGLALALGKPCVGVSTLEALAGEGGGLRGGAVGSAADVFFALYDGGDARVPPGRFTIDEARALAPEGASIHGPAAGLLARPGLSILEAAHADPVVLARIAAGRDPDAHPPAPQYLRAPDAKLPGGLTPP
ncbi:MAG: putative protease [Alphaproteobacteria bacterium]|nr:MAG: putative protease [Caulobacteraceae bacterium]TPW06395.1 MAG: putative protease [Alphaproteobacteria bacterium]